MDVSQGIRRLHPIPTPAWLVAWLAGHAQPHEALASFDALPGIEPDEMLGRWRGADLRSKHPFDGILKFLGWHGKIFETDGTVHPLVFRSNSGRLVNIDPARIPVRFLLHWPELARTRLARVGFFAAQPLLQTRKPAARIDHVSFRGITSTAMFYLGQPITDHFRKIDEARVLGLMELRGMEQPFFFMLERESALAPLLQ